MTKRYHISTYGCQMNEHDSERIAGLFEADGYQPSSSVEDADVVVLNTCCIRENADNKLYGALGHLKPLKDANPDLKIMVGGCLAQKDKDLIQTRAGHVDVVFGTHNVHRAMELLTESSEVGPVLEIWEDAIIEEARAFPSALPVRRETDYAAWVTIQIGCDNTCAYCIVPAVRGPEISRRPADIRAEVERLVGEGVTEVTLLGQNVNSYGRDLAVADRRAGHDVHLRPQFAELLREVGAVDGIRRVRFTSPHPKDMTAEVFAAMAETPAVVPHLHFPLQSGSDRVLAAMHRGYTAARFLDKLEQAREVIPDLAVTTDIIVGFPGETEADFVQTLEAATAADFDSAYTFVFSPREGTEAATLTANFCDPEAVKDRYRRLRVVIERHGRARHAARVGRTEEVVIEGPSKKDRSVLTGRTGQNKLVHFSWDETVDGSAPRPGTYALVEVTDARTQYLLGRFVEINQPASHRTRIPVTAL